MTASDRPLEGRQLYFVGIGGAGSLRVREHRARAGGGGARVGRRARRSSWRRSTESTVDVGGEPDPPAGFRGRRLDRAPRARRGTRRGPSSSPSSSRSGASIVVGGAHGKTTTAAMIAFVLRELGADPSWIIGGVVPQLGGNAGAGDGWLVVEGDESDRSIALLRPEIAVRHERRARPPRDVRSPRRSSSGSSTSGSREVPLVVRGWELDAGRGRARRPGRPQPAERRGGARRARARRRRAQATRRPRSRASPGVDRRFELVGERGRHQGLRRLRPQPHRDRGHARDGADDHASGA